MDEAEVQEFLRAQSEAAFWCDHEGRQSSFRTPGLNPSLSAWPTQAEFGTALETLRLHRRALLGAFDGKAPRAGRLLLCEVNESISSGESEAETSGFFDISDRPPWDTWVWQFPSVGAEAVAVVSWVPRDLEAVVGRGIEVNPYACIRWLTDAPLGIKLFPGIRALLDAGLR